MALLIDYFVCHDRSIKRDDLIDRRLTNHWSRSSFVRHFHLAGSPRQHSVLGVTLNQRMLNLAYLRLLKIVLQFFNA